MNAQFNQSNNTRHLLVLKIFNKWWQYKVGKTVRGTPIGIGPNIPTQVLYCSEEVYDITDNIVIKSRSNTHNFDALKLQLWLDEKSIPEFIYPGFTAFRVQLEKYYKKTSNET